jgi:hypothetical protein
MAKSFKGVVNVDVTESVPDWGAYTQPIAPEGTPSVLCIVLDDVGFSAMEPFSGLIRDPEHQPLSASSGRRPTSGIPTWCTTTTRSSSRRCPRRATT